MKSWNIILAACLMLLFVVSPADAATRLKTKEDAAKVQTEQVEQGEQEVAQNSAPMLAAVPATPAPAAAPAPAPALPTANSIAQDMQKALTTPAAPEAPEVDKAQVQKLIKTLQSPREREAFIGNLKGMLAAEGISSAEKANMPPGERALNALSQTVTGLGKNFSLIGKGFADLPQTVAWLQEQFSNQDTRDQWLKLFALVGLALLAGSAALFGVRFLLRGPRKMLAKMPALPFPTHLIVFVSYHFLTLMPVVAFTLASLFTAQSIEMPEASTQATITLLYAFIVLQLCMWVLKMVFASSAPSRRLLPMANETAAYLYVWLMRLSGIIIFGTFLSRGALLLDVPENTVHAFASLMGLVVTLMVVIIVLQNRRPVAEWLRGKPEEEEKKETAKEKRRKIFLQSLRLHLAGVWHVLAIIYLLGGYLVATLDVEQGFATLTRATVVTVLVLLGFHFLLRGIDRLIASGFALPAELRRQFPRLEERTNSYLPLLQRALKIMVWGAGIVVLLGAWGVDTMAWFTENPGQKFFSAAISITVTLVLTVLLWELVGSMVERYLKGDERNGKKVERSARIRTLLPLARYAVQVVLIIVAGVIILSEIGVNTTPFLAGAGIIGLAIGFGSQALVKDFITGLFILMEDTLSVGDIVKAGTHSGVVEGITIRTVRLRDGQGHLHTVPFGELTSIINMTRHFAQVVFEIPVAFDADWRKVMQVMKDVAEEMRKDDKFQKAIYEPIQIQGIDRYETSWAIIMGVLKVQPLQQWNVKREYLLRLKERLDKENIPLPYAVNLNLPFSMIREKTEAPKLSKPSKPSVVSKVVSKKVAPAKPTPPAETKDQAKALKNLDEANPPLPTATKA